MDYITPANSFSDMVAVRANSLRASTSKITQLLRHSKSCTCGHQKDYHINGKERCMFGVCSCQGYQRFESTPSHS